MEPTRLNVCLLIVIGIAVWTSVLWHCTKEWEKTTPDMESTSTQQSGRLPSKVSVCEGAPCKATIDRAAGSAMLVQIKVFDSHLMANWYFLDKLAWMAACFAGGWRAATKGHLQAYMGFHAGIAHPSSGIMHSLCLGC